MSSLYQVNAGDRILAVDNIQFYNLLKGVAASGENILLIYNAGALTLQPSSDPAAGTRVLTIKNNAGTTLFAARYDGLLEMLAAAAAPGTPVAGSVYWDTLLAALRVYDGTNWRDMAGGSTGPNPNLVLNSDFSRRTVFGLAMPEVFADLSGTTKIDGGAAGSVASNIFTQGAANNEYAWCAGSFVWRDGRASATFKATATAGLYALRWRISATDWIEVRQNAGNFTLNKFIASAFTTPATVANALTLNRWYWLELEKQGTTITVRMYDTGGTASGVTKASSTLIAASVLTATVSDASVQVGAHVSIVSDQAAAQWGGIATGNGGVYVETWLPESFTFNFAAGAQSGGLAFGIDESADSGPIGRQYAARVYVPATSRRLDITQTLPDGSVAPSTTYQFSQYVKVSGKGGTGTLIQTHFYSMTSALAAVDDQFVSDASETSWTRKSLTSPVAVGATTRRGQVYHAINVSQTATGTVYFSLPQLEQGSAVTAWRNAPADDAPIVYDLSKRYTADLTTTSAALVEMDSRDMALNLFAPWDCEATIEHSSMYYNSGVGNDTSVSFTVAGSNIATTTVTKHRSAVATTPTAVLTKRPTKLSAGKTRVAVTWAVTAGTENLWSSSDTTFMVVLTRGK